MTRYRKIFANRRDFENTRLFVIGIGLPIALVAIAVWFAA